MASDGTTTGRADANGGPADLADLARREALSTFGPRVMKLSGAFAGLFRLDYDEKIFQRNYRNPVLVACRAGAGAKADLALRAGRLVDLAMDVVAATANDMLTVGAEPLFLLHHLAVQVSGQQQLQVIEGLVDGCRRAGFALLGAEQAVAGPAAGQGGLDLAAFAVGVCDHRRMITGEQIDPDDEVIGITETALHGRAYDLAVSLLLEQPKIALDARVEEMDQPVAEVLLRPARIYVPGVLRVLRYYRRKRVISGIMHVRQRGLAGSIEAVLPEDRRVQIEPDAWQRPPIYTMLAQAGTSREELLRTTAMGIGFVMVVRPAFTQSILKQLRRRKMDAHRIGRVSKGARQVQVGEAAGS